MIRTYLDANILIAAFQGKEEVAVREWPVLIPGLNTLGRVVYVHVFARGQEEPTFPCEQLQLSYTTFTVDIEEYLDRQSELVRGLLVGQDEGWEIRVHGETIAKGKWPA